MDKLRLFLSYAKENSKIARQLRDRLETLGISVWLDDVDLLPGQEWDLEIAEAIAKAHVVILCLSKAVKTKTGFVQAEIRRALDVAERQPEGSIYVIPVRIEECEVPLRLKHLQWVDLFEKTDLRGW